MERKTRNALVTGSTHGIGLEVAASFARAGFGVGINGRDRTKIQLAVETVRALGGAGGSMIAGFCGDVTLPDQAERITLDFIDAFGRLDVLICNVGSGSSVPPGNENNAEWKRVFDINLFSTTNMVESVKDRMQGAIVCISSICGVESIPGAPVTYTAAKAALNAYIKGISRPLATKGIRINGIAPGNILFDGSVWDRKLREQPAAVEAMLKSEVSLGTLGAPQDIAELAMFLASERARFATGAIWTLDGGHVRGF